MSFVSGCHELEREALIKFKDSLIVPAPQVYSWKGEDCCRWQGVTCHNVTQHVLRLDLRKDLSLCRSNINMSSLNITCDDTWSHMLGASELDPSLLELRQLRYLDLSGNGFILNHIPEFIGSMKQLRYLNLSKAGLYGVVPSQLGKLTRLQALDLSKNFLKGPISHFLSNMSSLRFLVLSNNHLNGSIPLLLENMRQLEFLNLQGNSFSQVEGGTIMGILGKLCHLKVLNLSENYVLGGDILSSNLKNSSKCGSYDLETLHLGSNNITGTLPFWLGELKNLRVLALGNNRLHGPILPSIRNLSLLEELYMRGCGLTGSIPSFHGRLASLKMLDLSDNFLYGYIPPSLGELSFLVSLNLSMNFLTGGGYLKIGNLTSLKVLDLSYNPLNFNGSLDKLPTFQLRDLRMRSCKIEGQFPEWIKMQNELIVLDISNNKIFGKLAKWIPSVKLHEMNLSHNHFIGPIPSFLSSSMLSSIDLSYNFLSGPLLHESSVKKRLANSSLCNLKNLALLDLKHNQLSGIVPDCWGYSSSSLSVIDLSSNKLSGLIPVTLGLNLQMLTYLKLNNNSLEGEIPSTLGFCSQLIILDLGENKLTGSIPNWGDDYGTFPILAVLRIRNNLLEGIIPPRLCSLFTLQNLDLAKNNLTGSIPSCFGQLYGMGSTYDPQKSVAMSPAMSPSMAYALPPKSPHEENAMVVLKGEELQYTTTLKYVINLDLSCNGLVGAIPQELTYLTGLIGLNLSYNHLTGSIPDKIGEMRSLESLDLSNNHLSGTIPSSMAALTSLSSLNLSSNKLHGEIPTGRQLQTLNDPSIYTGNAGLCGDPLPNECGGKHGQLQQQHEEEDADEDEDTLEKVLFYVVIMLGFATGFWGVVGSLLLKNTWRHALFRRVEDITDYFYMQVVIRINRLIKS